MDARLQEICAMVGAKPRAIDDIVVALKTSKAMAGALVGRLAAAGVLARDGVNVTVTDTERVRAIVAGEIDKLPMGKRKKKKKSKASEALPPPVASNGHDVDLSVIFGKDEDGDLNIGRRDGEGVPMVIAWQEIPRLIAYIKANFKQALRS